MQKHTHRGNTLVVVLVFMGIFGMLLSSLMTYLASQHAWIKTRTEDERALQIAEAGIEYYRWRLSHFPEDVQDGTGGPGPYVHVYEDPELGPIGEFSLEIGGDVLCGKVQVVTATSTGHTYNDPSRTRTIYARIARPTVADYSYIVDSNVWAGDTRTIIGPYHGNGVVRMDADNRSAVTSMIDTTSCAGAGLGGCSGTINGVYGTGDHPEWWRWNQQGIPFSNFDYDFGEMEALAQADGIHLPKISNDTSVFGYYLDLQSNGSVDIYRVTSAWWIEHYTPGSEYVWVPELYGTLSSRMTFIENRDIPDTCPLIYVEDRTWLEGEVSGKVTVVANDQGAATPDLLLQGNIEYVTGGGVDGLTVLAERNLLIALMVPNVMTIEGIFFAQKGAYGRSWYPNLGTTYNGYREQSTLNTNGTVVSKLRTGTQWGTTQGFEIRNDFYDRHLAEGPPPLTPYTSQNFRFIEWREVQ